MPTKQDKKEEELIRQPHGDLAEYKRDTYAGPNISKAKGPVTIVPQGGEIDQALKPKTEMNEVGLGDDQPHYMADGGMVGLTDDAKNRLMGFPSTAPASSFDVGGAGTTAVNSLPQNLTVNPTTPSFLDQFKSPDLSGSYDEKGDPALPSAPVPAQDQPMPAQAKPPVKLPGMPAGVTPDDLQPYLQQQKANINKFGPQEQVDLEKSLMAQRNGLGHGLISGAKGLADAVMMGVAGAGNPGWQNAYENQQDQRANEQLGTLQKAHEGQIQDTEAGMKLDMADPKSPISKAYRKSFAPIFSKMGYSPESIAKMSASQVGTVADLGVRFSDAQTQLQLKEAMLGVQTLTAQANIENNKLQRMEAEQKMGAEHPVQRMLGMLPKTVASAAQGVAGANAPPYGQIVKRGGVTYEWSPISGKYHPKS